MKYKCVNMFKIALICLTILFLGLMSASITHAVSVNAVSTNYQYQAWGQYKLINLSGEKYVPLNNNVGKLAKLVLDSKSVYTLKTGENLDLGGDYVSQQRW